jgi:hypothetical protein
LINCQVAESFPERAVYTFHAWTPARRALTHLPLLCANCTNGTTRITIGISPFHTKQC